MRVRNRRHLRRGVKPERDWRDALRAGDVILEGGDKLKPRTVRRAVYWGDGTLHAVDLVIFHCSWTHRCLTTINRNDLKQRRFTKAGRRVELNDELSRRIREETFYPSQPALSCCDVEGIR